MDRWMMARMIRRNAPVSKTAAIRDACAGKRVLDLGCIRHSAAYALSDPNWLHKTILDVAGYVLGVDYLPEDVETLCEKGYNIVFGDVTEPLAISETFDVIVAGDLIEHLSDFRGFFANCSRLLDADGTLILTTPNPFFAGEFHYVALKRAYIVNPEHTCWIDPCQMSQLCERHGFAVADARMLTEAWDFASLVWDSPRNSYDILGARWPNDTFSGRVLRKLTTLILRPLYWCFATLTIGRSRLVTHSDYIVYARPVVPKD